MNWYLIVLKKYAVFDGRARRKEYWMFFLINIIIAFILGAIEGLIEYNFGSDATLFGNIYQLAILIPSIAVGIRRMHDIGRSGWYYLIPIYNLFLLAREGDKGDNRYGADPKADASNVQASTI